MIIITGMHRSGTSMIAQLLLEIGLDLGDTSGFYGADSWNERGYIEQIDVINVNSKLITGFERTKNRAKSFMSKLVYLNMPAHQKIQKRANKMKHSITKIGSRYSDKVVKDTRFCLTIDSWRDYVSIEKVIVCLRHPTETILSLKKRQNIPLWLGYRFWNYHVKSLLNHLGSEPTLFINFNILASSEYEQELNRIACFFKLEKAKYELKSHYDKIFAPDLVHHRAYDNEELPLKTHELWGRLMSLYNNQ